MGDAGAGARISGPRRSSTCDDETACLSVLDATIATLQESAARVRRRTELEHWLRQLRPIDARLVSCDRFSPARNTPCSCVPATVGSVTLRAVLRRVRGDRARNVAALLGYVGCSVVLFWPVVARVAESVAFGGNDPILFIWWLRWDAYAVLHGHFPLRTGWLNYR